MEYIYKCLFRFYDFHKFGDHVVLGPCGALYVRTRQFVLFTIFSYTLKGIKWEKQYLLKKLRDNNGEKDLKHLELPAVKLILACLKWHPIFW